MDEFRSRLNDLGSSGTMVVPDLWPHWQAFLDGIKSQVSGASHDELCTRLAVAAANVRLGQTG